jgi:hypothetical protein
MSVNLSIVTGGSAAHGFDDWRTTQQHSLGTLAKSNDGSIFAYAQAGGADLVVGNVLQRAAPIGAHLAMTPPNVALGATSFTCTPGAAAGAANLYAEGYMQVDTAPGNGDRYVVSGHAAIASGTAFTLNLEEPIRTALTAAGSKIGLHHHRYKAVIQTPTALTAGPAGVAVAPIPANNYGWILVDGPWPVLIVGTPAVTAPLITSATVPGGVDVYTAGAMPTAALIGQSMQVGVGGKNNMAWIRML